MHHELTWGLRLDPQKRKSIDTGHFTCSICHHLQKIMSEWNWITEHPLAVPEELIEFWLVRKNIPFLCSYRSDLVIGSKKNGLDCLQQQSNYAALMWFPASRLNDLI